MKRNPDIVYLMNLLFQAAFFRKYFESNMKTAIKRNFIIALVSSNLRIILIHVPKYPDIFSFVICFEVVGI